VKNVTTNVLNVSTMPVNVTFVLKTDSSDLSVLAQMDMLKLVSLIAQHVILNVIPVLF